MSFYGSSGRFFVATFYTAFMSKTFTSVYRLSIRYLLGSVIRRTI